MPQPGTDWSAVRSTWLACENFAVTAKAHGLSHDAVRQRASREKWQEARRNTLSQIEKTGVIVTSVPKVVSHLVTPPHEAMGNALSDQSAPTKLGLAIAARKAAVAASRKPAKALLSMGADILPWMKVASGVHGWDEGRAPSAVVNILTQSIERIEVSE